MNKKILLFYFCALIVISNSCNNTKFKNELESSYRLRISENHRFLIKGDGTPFIWIGDTFWGWYTFSPDKLDEYLEKRKAQGFTVIQVQLAVYGGADYAGNWCFGGDKHKDITQPQEAFWQYADLWIDKIEEHGLFAAVGLSWIITFWSRYDKAGDPGKIYSVSDYYNYGKWVGNRYKDQDHIIWLGLNEATYQTAPNEKIKAVCDGIRDGDIGNKLVSLHPLAGSHSSENFSDVVDFYSWQTARFSAPDNLPYRFSVPEVPDHVSGADILGNFTAWEAIESDYNKLPVKPVIDLEAWYENGPDDMPVNATGSIATPWHVRSRAYFTIFAGAFGHTYGAYRLAYDVEGDSWRQALELPGGIQMGYIAKLLGDEERSFLKLTPCQELITYGQSRSYDSHKQAALASDGSYAYVYTADGSNFSLDLTKLGKSGSIISSRWYNPRDGMFLINVEKLERVTNQLFTPPSSLSQDDKDWVLVLTVDK